MNERLTVGKEAKAEQKIESMIELKIPVGTPTPGAGQAHIDFQLTEAESAVFERIRAGLRDHPQRLASRVPGLPGRMANHENGADILRWLLHEVGARIAAR